MTERLTEFESLLEIVLARAGKATPPFLVAIAGPPGSGKSTLAERLVTELGATGHAACLCPMDGFHLTNAQLKAAGLVSAKGRIDTFDGVAFTAAVSRLRTGASFWWPLYSRESHDPVPEGTRIDGSHRIYVIEGNYLYDDREPWRSVRGSYNLSIFVDMPDERLRERLMKRHRKSGRTEREALERIDGTDMPNARSIRAGVHDADIRFIERDSD